MRLIILALIIFNSQVVGAYSSERLIQFYENFYVEELGIGFLTQDYNIRDPKLRQQILSYMKSKDLEVTDKEIQTNWLSFINIHYPNPIELQKTVEENYHDLDRAKTKFIDDLDLKNYFHLVVKPRLEDDFKLRDRLMGSVITNKMSKREKFEAQTQLLTILELKTVQDLEDKYSLNQEDLDYLLSSNFLLDKKSFSVYNLDLQKRIYNLKANSNLSSLEAKKLIFKNYNNRSQYLQ